MRTSLQRSAALERAARDRAWAEVEGLQGALEEALREIQETRSNGDSALAQSMRRSLDQEREKVREHRGVEARAREADRDAGESTNTELADRVREARES